MVDIEPLGSSLWFDALAKLFQRSNASCGHDVERLLRHAYHLTQLTSRQLAGDRLRGVARKEGVRGCRPRAHRFPSDIADAELRSFRGAD
jgi:hypothetical protein